MEKQTQTSLSLLTLLPGGKVENDVRIADKTVTGICTVYVSRTDSENEFLLREIGIATLEDGNLTAAVRTAVDQAYHAAISHIAGVIPAAMEPAAPTSARPTQPKAATAPKSTEKEESSATSAVQAEPDPTDDPDPGTATEPPSVDLKSIVTMPEQGGSASGRETPAPSGEVVGDNIERVDFTESLFPASDSPDTDGGSTDDDDNDPDYQKALDMEITIFGKLHECNGWKAGKILAERPDVIVDFCHRNSESYEGPKYTGPRTDQKEALFKLYPDAALRMEKAA